MEKMKAMEVMSALSQPTRLKVFELLITKLPEGMAAGEIAEAIGTIPSAMSAHLAILSRAGLVKSKKVGRSVVYRADVAKARQLIQFLERVLPT
jgi:DNA-binding transcriptional ArsR family regulator